MPFMKFPVQPGKWIDNQTAPATSTTSKISAKPKNIHFARPL